MPDRPQAPMPDGPKATTPDGPQPSRARTSQHRDARAERIAGIAFLVSLASGVALLALYLLGGQTQLEGVLLTLCLGGIGVGIIVWAQELLPRDEEIEERHPLASPVDPVGAPRPQVIEARDSTDDPIPDSTLRRQAEEQEELRSSTHLITRRVALIRLLVAAFGGLAAAVAVPIFSLGPLPGRSLFVTSWRPGLRLVDEHGIPVNASRLPVGSVMTVFPEGVSEIADAQAVLIHVEPGLLRLTGQAAQWAPSDFVCYSKVCTHAGCPVGLYNDRLHELVCPCHQSAFDILDGAKRVAGPAVRPLPQLPIRLQPDGTFVALSDFPEPVGPSFWNIDLGPVS